MRSASQELKDQMKETKEKLKAAKHTFTVYQRQFYPGQVDEEVKETETSEDPESGFF